MASATLDSPITVDPRTGNKVFIRRISVDNLGNAIAVTAELRDASDVVILVKDFAFRSAGVTAWIRGIEPDALALVLADLGVTGTVA
jgi:hypothetical protein